MNKNKIATF